MAKAAEQPQPREVEIVNSDYPPTAAELNEDMRVDATFGEAGDAFTKPVVVKHIDRPKTK